MLWLGSEQSLPDAYWRMHDDVSDELVRQKLQKAPAQQVENRITIIDIDEASLEIFGSWPWPRSLTAQLIERIGQHQPQVIALDIVFPDMTQTKEDRLLSAALVKYPVVLAQAFDLNPMSTPPQAGFLTGGMNWSGEHVLAHGFIANHADLVKAVSQRSTARCVGHITPSPSADGVVRHIAPWIKYQDTTYPMLAWAMLDCAKTSLVSSSEWRDRQSSLHLLRGQWRFPWVRTLDAYTVVSTKDILSGQVGSDLLSQRYVLIGSSALGIGDRVASPVAPWLPGVMVHAQILTHFLDQQEYDGEPSTLQGGHTRALALFYSMITLLMISFFLYRQNMAWSLGAALGTSLVWWWGIEGLNDAGWSTNYLLPWVMVLLWLFVYVPTEWWIAQEDHQEKLRRLGAYLAPSVLPRLLAEDYEDLLKPQRREITILFADVANYTAISEKLTPEALSQLTQAILSELTEAVHEQQGTLDKYMGDAVMAFWGAPLKDNLHADRAIACALGMQARILQSQLLWQKKFGLLEPIQIRVGVNTGEVVVGEMGSTMRKTYTAIGDAVNIAARLQEQAKIWQHPILLGEATSQASHQHQLISLGSMTLRGKYQTQIIYSLHELGLPKGLNL